MTPDMTDAHETAQARDERPRRGSTFAEAAAEIVQGLASLRTRTHSINPETGEFTQLDFHREWLHVMDTQRPHTSQGSDMPTITRTITVRLDPELRDLLTEIRDRLPGRVEVKVAPFDPDVIAANLEAIKHEVETPMRGHGECCDPAPVPRPEPADITEEPHKQRHSDDANCEWAQYRKDYGVEPTDATHKAFHAGFKAAQKCAKDGGWSGAVDTAPAGVDPDEGRADEELAKVILSAYWNMPTEFTEESERRDYLAMARAAREHIHLTDKRYESDLALFEHAVKAEADLARVTEELDNWRASSRDSKHAAKRAES